MTSLARALPALFAVLLGATGAVAREAPLAGAGIEERVGSSLPQDVALRDLEGRELRLGSFFVDPDAPPVLLSLAYYRCKMLCGHVLEAAASALDEAQLRPGQHLRLVTVSIDPNDDAGTARHLRSRVLAEFDPDADPDSWPFFLADEEEVRRLAEALGFHYRYDPKTGQYAHPAVVFAVTPDGRVSSYLYGVDFGPAQLRTALKLASHGGAAATTSPILMRCFEYVPALRRYAGAITVFLRVGAAVSLAAFAAFVWAFVRRRRHRPVEVG